MGPSVYWSSSSPSDAHVWQTKGFAHATEDSTSTSYFDEEGKWRHACSGEHRLLPCGCRFLRGFHRLLPSLPPALFFRLSLLVCTSPLVHLWLFPVFFMMAGRVRFSASSSGDGSRQEILDQVLAQLDLFWYLQVVLSGRTKSECFACSHRHRLDRIPLAPGLFTPCVRLDCQRSVSLLRTDAVLETTTGSFDASLFN